MTCPAIDADIAGSTYTASNGIASARAQDAYSNAVALGLNSVEANQVFVWAYRNTMRVRGF